MRGRSIIECDWCGTEMSRKNSRIGSVNFCGLKCRHAYNRGLTIDNKLKKEIYLSHNKDKWTLTEIAEFYNLGRATVCNLLKEYKDALRK